MITNIPKGKIYSLQNTSAGNGLDTPTASVEREAVDTLDRETRKLTRSSSDKPPELTDPQAKVNKGFKSRAAACVARIWNVMKHVAGSLCFWRNKGGQKPFLTMDKIVSLMNDFECELTLIDAELRKSTDPAKTGELRTLYQDHLTSHGMLRGEVIRRCDEALRRFERGDLE